MDVNGKEFLSVGYGSTSSADDYVALMPMVYRMEYRSLDFAMRVCASMQVCVIIYVCWWVWTVKSYQLKKCSIANSIFFPPRRKLNVNSKNKNEPPSDEDVTLTCNVLIMHDACALFERSEQSIPRVFLEECVSPSLVLSECIVQFPEQHIS